MSFIISSLVSLFVARSQFTLVVVWLVLPLWLAWLILRSVNLLIVAHSVKSATANPNNLNVPRNDAAHYPNNCGVLTGTVICPCLSWPLGMYYRLIQPDPASLVWVNSLQHEITLLAMTVDNWRSTPRYTYDLRSSQYKHDFKALFFIYCSWVIILIQDIVVNCISATSWWECVLYFLIRDSLCSTKSGYIVQPTRCSRISRGYHLGSAEILVRGSEVMAILWRPGSWAKWLLILWEQLAIFHITSKQCFNMPLAAAHCKTCHNLPIQLSRV